MRARRKTSQTNWRKRALELSLEIAAALVLVVGIVAFALFGPKKPIFAAKWIPFGINTALVFGTVIHLTKPLWNKVKLWATVIAFLGMHVVVGWFVLRGVERVALMWYVPVVLGEINAIVYVLERVFTAAELEAAAPNQSVREQ